MCFSPIRILKKRNNSDEKIGFFTRLNFSPYSWGLSLESPGSGLPLIVWLIWYGHFNMYVHIMCVCDRWFPKPSSHHPKGLNESFFLCWINEDQFSCFKHAILRQMAADISHTFVSSATTTTTTTTLLFFISITSKSMNFWMMMSMRWRSSWCDFAKNVQTAKKRRCFEESAFFTLLFFCYALDFQSQCSVFRIEW